MENRIELQVTTVGEFIAESLENQANRMPPSYKAEAGILREQARLLRKTETKTIRIWREVMSEG